jgi:hypothetical protein
MLLMQSSNWQQVPVAVGSCAGVVVGEAPWTHAQQAVHGYEHSFVLPPALEAEVAMAMTLLLSLRPVVEWHVLDAWVQVPLLAVACAGLWVACMHVGDGADQKVWTHLLTRGCSMPC